MDPRLREMLMTIARSLSMTAAALKQFIAEYDQKNQTSQKTAAPARDDVPVKV